MARYLLLFIFLLFPTQGYSASATGKSDHVTATLFTPYDALLPTGEETSFLLQLQLAPNWHSYYINPGDAGLPADFNWKSNVPLSFGNPIYPTPSVIPLGPVINYGYEGTYTITIPITHKTLTEESVTLDLTLQLLVCETICIPESLSLTLTLPVQNKRIGTHHQRFNEITAQYATPATATTQQTSNHIILSLAKHYLPPTTHSAYYFHDKEAIIPATLSQPVSIDREKLTLTLLKPTVPLHHLNGIIALYNQKGQLSKTYRINEAITDSASISTIPWLMLGFAFLGGLLLNLMPCVFPVLAIKALSLMQKAGQKHSHVRYHAIIFVFGILLTFTLLAFIMLLLREAGEQIGWGFQLQSPMFVTSLIYIFTFIGLSLSGYFIFGSRLMGIGQNITTKNNYSASFFSGMLATIVATPCSVPFMAPAIGVALTQPLWIALAIFGLVGLGMAFPYCCFVLFPSLASSLPKPGKWMERFKEFLAFFMYGTAIWLLWVLGKQAGLLAVTLILIGLLALLFALWVHRQGRHPLYSLAAAIAILIALFASYKATHITKNPLVAVPYSETALNTYLKEGKSVFINFTAAWCITCKANEFLTFSNSMVVERFRDPELIYMVADWTDRNDPITQKLESFQRSGVPLYVFYHYTQPDSPTLLPQLLTPRLLLNQLHHP